MEVVPIRFGSAGFHIGGQGRIVEYAVKMRQFDEHQLFSLLFETQQLTVEHMSRLGVRLADIHREALRDPIKARRFGSAEAVLAVVNDNYHTTREFLGWTHSEQQDGVIKRFTNRLFDHHSDWF